MKKIFTSLAIVLTLLLDLYFVFPVCSEFVNIVDKKIPLLSILVTLLIYLRILPIIVVINRVIIGKGNFNNKRSSTLISFALLLVIGIVYLFTAGSDNGISVLELWLYIITDGLISFGLMIYYSLKGYGEEDIQAGDSPMTD